MFTVNPTEFNKQYVRLNKTYGDGMPAIVSYYQENEVVHIYMWFNGMIIYTRIGVEDKQVYLVNFQDPIRLVDKPHYG